MRAYSEDLRRKALETIDRGGSYRRVAAAFGVGPATVGRDVRQRRERGHVRARPHLGPRPEKADALRAWLPGRLAERNDATLAEHGDAFAAETGVAVSTATVSRAVASLPGGAWTSKQRRSPR